MKIKHSFKKFVANDFVIFLNDLKCFENDKINKKSYCPHKNHEFLIYPPL